MVCHSIKNQVITLSVFGEIFLRVINDLVCANRAHHVQIPRAAHASDFSLERFGNLHRKRTHTTGRTINQNLLPRLNLSFIAKTLQGGECRYRDGCCFLKRYIGWFQRQCIFTSTYILGKSARTTPRYSEHFITWLELLDVSSDCLNPSGHISSELRIFWFEKPVH